MKKSKLTLILSLGLINLLSELVLRKTSDDNITNLKILKIKNFFKKIRNYRKTRILLSVIILIFSNFETKSYFVDKPYLKPITFHFSEGDDIICGELDEYFDFLGNPRVQEVRRKSHRLIVKNDLRTGEQSLRISFELHELLRLVGRGKGVMFIAIVMRIVLIGTLPGTIGMGRIIDAFILLHKKGKISSRLLKILLELLFDEYGQIIPPELQELLESSQCVPA